MMKCSEAKCHIAENGACLEGHAENCPHLVQDLVESADANGPELSPPNIPVSIPSMPEPHRFHSGEKLVVSEASRLLKDKGAYVVFCAGTQWAGKTTFLARLGEMFRSGIFQKYRFAGSKTLCGFERATWLATISSGQARPETSRTNRVENDTFFHLKVYNQSDPTSHKDILISDLAGETFPSAIANRDFCLQLRGLARADHLALFLDCASLIDGPKRHSERDNALGFLRQVANVQINPSDLNVQIVFSRWDHVELHAQRQIHAAFCDAVKADIIQRFGDVFANLSFWHIAARPEGMAPTNDEIQSIFCCWLDTPIWAEVPVLTPTRIPLRDFSGFGLS